MKRISILIAFTTIVTCASAQYKKASVFTRSGTFYELGATFRMLGDGRTGGTGFFLNLGRGGAHFHSSLDFEVVTPVSFNYTTASAYVSTPSTVQVSGKSKIIFLARYSLGYFFADNTNDDVKLLPFLNAGIGYLYGDGQLDYTTTPSIGSPAKYPSNSVPSLNLSGGGGLLYKITNGIGIRGAAAYNIVSGTKDDYYPVLKNHPSVTVGIRFMVNGEN